MEWVATVGAVVVGGLVSICGSIAIHARTMASDALTEIASHFARTIHAMRQCLEQEEYGPGEAMERLSREAFGNLYELRLSISRYSFRVPRKMVRRLEDLALKIEGLLNRGEELEGGILISYGYSNEDLVTVSRSLDDALRSSRWAFWR